MEVLRTEPDQSIRDHPQCPGSTVASRRRARGAREHPVQVTASLVNCERVAVKLTIGSSQKTPLTAPRCVLMIFSLVDFQKTQEKVLYLHHHTPLWNTSRADFSMNVTSKSLIYTVRALL